MPRKVKSSLVDHHFPRFYACYLLKSIRTPRATATYIGSTPSPPRRIRQHNGEISQGAWKTKHNRPWVMQMIVYGFPSKLTALQFEWAWQHPHISRHLRDDDGKAVFQMSSKSRYLRSNVSIAQNMICSHPYNTWPLHVKLFTVEAEKAWKEASQDHTSIALPRGFTCTVELEGVDGKSGKVGTGRIGPINVDDSQFTSEHLSKWTTLLALGSQLRCSICNETLNRQDIEPMNVALCPTANCNAVSHPSCLCSDFLEQERAASTASNGFAIIPRGGECRECREYVLWGDVVRGCYRRRGDDAPELQLDNDEDFDDREDQSSEDGVHASPTRIRSKKPLSQTTNKRRAVVPKKRPALAQKGSSEGEFFDLNNVSGDSEDDIGRTSHRRLPSADIVPSAQGQNNQEATRKKSHRTDAASNLAATREEVEAIPPLLHVARKVLRKNVVPVRRSVMTEITGNASVLQANAQTGFDHGLPPSGSQPRRTPRAEAVLTYVEISDSPGSDLNPEPSVEHPLLPPSVSDVRPETNLDAADDSDSIGHSRFPRRRLSRALSTLSISSGSELPDMSHILRDLKRKKQDGGEDVILVSD